MFKSHQHTLMRQGTQVLSFFAHAHTVKNIYKEMESVWDSLKVDGRELVVEHHMTRVKAQLVQLYAAKLMKLVGIHTNFDLVPVVKENVAVGNWRVDSLIVQVASNKVGSHEHLYQLLMTNIYGIPTVMFDFIKAGFTQEPLERYMRATYSKVEVPLDFEGEITEDALERFMDGVIHNSF
jgi:hypothetical protein